MVVTIKLFAHFRRGRFKETLQVLPEATTCGEVLAALGLEAGEAGIPWFFTTGTRVTP